MFAFPVFGAVPLARAHATANKPYNPINPRGDGIRNATIVKFNWIEERGEGDNYGFHGGNATITLWIHSDTGVVERVIHMDIAKSATRYFVNASYVGDLDDHYIEDIRRLLPEF